MRIMATQTASEKTSSLGSTDGHDSMANKPGAVLNEERRRSIVNFVNQNGRALVRDLAVQFGSSEITIRRDLDLLPKEGWFIALAAELCPSARAWSRIRS
jgi:Transcriptional regulators of sugar metabolism